MWPAEGTPKAGWRAAARQARLALDVAVIGSAVRAHLATWLAHRPPTTVLLYLATAVEIDVEPLVGEARLVGHRFAVTRAEPGGRLTLHPVDAPREVHRLGFAQAVADAAVVADGAIGVVLAPGLAFDVEGRRLGHGGGYYDRLLARLTGATSIGVTAEALVVPAGRLPVDVHDRPVDLLVTETGLRPSATAPPAPATGA